SSSARNSVSAQAESSSQSAVVYTAIDSKRGSRECLFDLVDVIFRARLGGPRSSERSTNGPSKEVPMSCGMDDEAAESTALNNMLRDVNLDAAAAGTGAALAKNQHTAAFLPGQFRSP